MQNPERRTITIIDAEHKKELEYLYRLCQGPASSFYLREKHWRFEGNYPWESDVVALQEVLEDVTTDTHLVEHDQLILRGQWEDQQ